MIARCACEDAFIIAEQAPKQQGICHCQNCKQRTGSAFGISAYFERKHIREIKGIFLCYAFHNQELNHDQERYFCQKCGTTLYWLVSTLPDLIGVAGGCFSQDLDEPTYSVNQSQKKPWVSLPQSWRQKE